MAQRRPPSEPDTEPVLRVARAEVDGEIQRRLAEGQELADRPIRSWDELNQLERDLNTWDEFNEELLRRRFSTGKVADEYKRVTVGLGVGSNPQRQERLLRDSLTEQMRRLTVIRQRLDLYGSEVESAQVVSSSTTPSHGTKIFLVHGHDGELKLQVAQFIQDSTGQRPIILHEPADSGRTIIEKFEDHASEAGFAVILLTADDVGSKRGTATQVPRARQNVVFEFGFFIAKLGRSRVVALYEEGIELPSDLSGVLYKQLAGNWHTELAKELRAVGIDVRLLDGDSKDDSIECSVVLPRRLPLMPHSVRHWGSDVDRESRRTGDRRKPRPGRSGCHRGLRSTFPIKPQGGCIF